MRNVITCVLILIVFSLTAQTPSAVSAFNKAVASYNKGDYKSAVGVLSPVAQDEPDFLEAQRFLAEAYQKMGDEEQTQYYYKRTMAAGGENADLWYRLGLSQKRSGDLDEAKKSFQQSLALDPNFVKSQKKLAAIEKTNAKPSNSTLQPTTETTPARAVAVSNPPANARTTRPAPSKKKGNSKKVTFYANKGVGYYNEGQFKEAAQAFEQAIAESGDAPNPKILCYAGRANIHIGEHDKAIQYLKDAVAKESDNGSYHYYLAQAYEQQGTGNLASKHTKMASSRGFSGTEENFNKLATTHYNKGLEMYNSKNYMGASQEFMKAIKENDKHAKYHYSLGLSLSKIDRVKEAIAAFEQAIAVDPSFDMAYTQMGHVLFDEGQFKKAGTYYKEAINLGNHSYNAYMDVGYCYDKMENHKKAITFFEEAEKINPDHIEVRFSCAMSHYKAGSYPEAKKRFTQLAKDLPESVRVLKNASALFGMTGDFETGLEYAMAWIKVAPQDGEAYNQAADMLMNLNRIDEGQKYKRKAKQLGCKKATQFY